MSSRVNDLERLDGDNRANAEGGERMYEMDDAVRALREGH